MRYSAITKALLWGCTASAGMAAFYAVVMLATMSAREAWYVFALSWYLIAGIIISFGAQVGLWAYLKQAIALRASGAAASGVSGAASGTAMLACCAHHLADALPVLGISGVAIFLARYQRPLLVLGLAINVLGIAYMLQLIRRHHG